MRFQEFCHAVYGWGLSEKLLPVIEHLYKVLARRIYRPFKVAAARRLTESIVPSLVRVSPDLLAS